MSDNTPPAVDPPAPSASHQDDAEELGMLARSISGVIGLAAGVGGAIGVFKTGTNSGGVPILLAVAAFFLYLAISGQRLTRLKIGDSEAQLSRVVKAAAKVLADPKKENQADLAETLDEVESKLPAATRIAVKGALSNRLDALDYERRIQDILRTMFPEEYAGEALNDGGRWDAILQNSERNVVVEMRYSSAPIGSATIAQLIGYMGAMSAISAGLLVVNQQLSNSAKKFLSTYSELRVAVVVWRSPDDNDDLRREAERLLRG